jgi:hypothetical protein
MSKDNFTKEWIIQNSIKICSQYEKGILTLRSLHYQLVGLGMTNDIQHYKRVVTAMISARWDDILPFDTFSDLDREMVGSTDYKDTFLDVEIARGKNQVQAWMEAYSKNKWENQPYYPEIFIEKKALQGVFTNICRSWNIGLGACKGYPSLTFLHEAYKRFREAEYKGKKPVIIYFGDYDPSGEDIPRSIQENIERFGVDVELRRIALMESQVVEWNLPPAPTKDTDTRSGKWEGLGQVELDAVRPERLMQLCESAIRDIFDEELHAELLKVEEEEGKQYRVALKEFVNDLKD